MPDISKSNGIDMADIAKINEQDVPSGGGGGTTTTTPTFTLDNSTVYLSQGVTITNTSSYTNAQFKVVVTAGATTIASVISTETNITWSDNNAATGARTVTVTADEFGDFIESAAATNTYSRTDLNFRYYRFFTVVLTAQQQAQVGTGFTTYACMKMQGSQVQRIRKT